MRIKTVLRALGALNVTRAAGEEVIVLGGAACCLSASHPILGLIKSC